MAALQINIEAPLRVLLCTQVTELQKIQLPSEQVDTELIRRFQAQYFKDAHTKTSQHLVTRTSDGRREGQINIIFDLNGHIHVPHRDVMAFDIRVEDSMLKARHLYNPNIQHTVNS